jgi:hypothetical protein
MIKEKYRTDIDEVLRGFLTKNATSLKSLNRIEYTEGLVGTGAIKKIAFDVYKVEDDPYKSLWLLENIEGKPYLVRASDPKFDLKSEGTWSAVSDYEHKNVTLSYKNIPIARFSSDNYNFLPGDVGSFKTALLELAADDQSFIKEVLAEQPEDKRRALAYTFPELNKFI